MKISNTAERVSKKDESDNYVYQRSLLAYLEAAKIISGRVLEIGTGNGYGIEVIAPLVDQFVTIDKNPPNFLDISYKGDHVTFLKKTVPKLTGIPDEYFDFVISFQVIEHVKDDRLFLKEISRVLKNTGMLIITTPNKKMSITRNPWHVREYTVSELKKIMSISFKKINASGVFGNNQIMTYYEQNRESVKKITRFDIFKFQYILPRQFLLLPYNLLNRMNRTRLLKENQKLVSSIKHTDYFIADAADHCFDLLFIAEKSPGNSSMKTDDEKIHFSLSRLQTCEQ
jgi:2-polyprenyl-3-methyl-5-hydroxy-6-metoxy-1,4-benzoquinol methylase